MKSTRLTGRMTGADAIRLVDAVLAAGTSEALLAALCAVHRSTLDAWRAKPETVVQRRVATALLEQHRLIVKRGRRK